MNTLDIDINAPFDLGNFNKNIDEYKRKCLKKLGDNSCLYKSDILDTSRYDVVVFDPSLDKNKFDSDDSELIYQITKTNDSYRVSTGKYVGSLTINKVNLKINISYGDFFLKRLLDFSNNVYFDNLANFSDNKNEDFLSKIIQYLFLSSLRRSLVNGFPMNYQKIANRDFNLKGNVDLKQYISHFTKNYEGVPYFYKAKKYDNDILSTLYMAFSFCDKNFVSSYFSDLKRKILTAKSDLKNDGFNENTIKKAKSSHLLNSVLYSSYKKTLTYAEMLILHKGYQPSDKIKEKQAHGWLIDVADLWELYLYNLIKIHFPDWDVLYQEELPIYKRSFFRRTFIPDIVMKKKGSNDVVIIDAKFKKMDFLNSDVDRNDLQQIHTYYSYYKSIGLNVRYFSLAYPARKKPSDADLLTSTIFDSNEKTNFGISYMLAGEDAEHQKENEIEFIDRLKKNM